MADYSKLTPESKVVAAGRPERVPDATLNPNIEFTSTFVGGGEIGYGRYGNNTWSYLEEAISALEGGQTLTFASGMAAITSVFSLFKNAIVVTSESGYTGTLRVLKNRNDVGDFEIRPVNITKLEEVKAALNGADLLWIESPTNPALEVGDLPKIIKAAKDAGVFVAADNTFSTGLIQQPLAMGADISMNSATKFLSGHSDAVMGSLSTNNDEVYNRLKEIRSLGGAIPGPFEAWLVLRGIRTLAVRIEKSERSTLEIAKRLAKHPAVENVRYPGLESDPAHQVAKSFMKGFGSVLSFEVKAGPEAADKICSATKLITFATSLGGVETLWERRHRWGSESPKISKSLVRLSVGIENLDDLWADIEQALSS